MHIAKNLKTKPRYYGKSKTHYMSLVYLSMYQNRLTLYRRYFPEISGLCLIKWPGKTLQRLNPKLLFPISFYFEYIFLPAQINAIKAGHSNSQDYFLKHEPLISEKWRIYNTYMATMNECGDKVTIGKFHAT